MTLDDVGKLLHCSRRTVFRLLDANAFPSMRVGRQRLVHVDDLARYVDSLRAR